MCGLLPKKKKDCYYEENKPTKTVVHHEDVHTEQSSYTVTYGPGTVMTMNENGEMKVYESNSTGELIQVEITPKSKIENIIHQMEFNGYELAGYNFSKSGKWVTLTFVNDYDEEVVHKVRAC